MKLSTLSALVPLIPALQAFVIVNPQDQHAQKVFLSRTEQQDVISDVKDTVVTDASYKDPFWHPASLIKTDIVDDDKHSYLSSLAGVIGKSDASKGQNLWRKAAGKLRGLKDDVVEALYDEDDEPHHPPPHKDHPPHDGPPHHGPPHDGPHHPPGHHHDHDFTDHTIYENIARSNYTTIATKYINKFPEIVKLLNSSSTKGNLTFFVPLDSAFHHHSDANITGHEKFVEKIILYHALAGFFPAKKVLVSHTLPSLLKDKFIGDDEAFQRLRIGLDFPRGLTVNFLSKIVVIDIFSSNGVIHGVNHVIFPPPPARKVLELLPGEFSTLTNALYKTGVIDNITHVTEGLTVFAPTNNQFKRLGDRILAFLFSKYGEKYLKALLQYHIVKGQVLYSDAYVKGGSAKDEGHIEIPKGRYHLDLETLLGKNLSIDILRYGRFISYKINGFTRVVVQDAIVMEGVFQIPDSVLIPPKKAPGQGMLGDGESNILDETMSVEELKERLEPYL